MTNVKSRLFKRGCEHVEKFCRVNSLRIPHVEEHPKSDWAFSECAYYRNNVIHICISSCAVPGHGGSSWSWPGGPIDRTPFGVLQHELGHHIDVLKSTPSSRDQYFGDFSRILREATQEPPLTNYCPNDGEWFAEMFRLFATNPSLLRMLRPWTYKHLLTDFTPITKRPWLSVLKKNKAPERILKMVKNKIKKQEKTSIV